MRGSLKPSSQRSNRSAGNRECCLTPTRNRRTPSKRPALSAPTFTPSRAPLPTPHAPPSPPRDPIIHCYRASSLSRPDSPSCWSCACDGRYGAELCGTTNWQMHMFCRMSVLFATQPCLRTLCCYGHTERILLNWPSGPLAQCQQQAVSSTLPSVCVHAACSQTFVDKVSVEH